MADKVAEIVEKIKELSLMEASELKKALEEEFGVTAAAPVIMAGGAAVQLVVMRLQLKNKPNSMLCYKPLAIRK